MHDATSSLSACARLQLLLSGSGAHVGMEAFRKATRFRDARSTDTKAREQLRETRAMRERGSPACSAFSRFQALFWDTLSLMSPLERLRLAEFGTVSSTRSPLLPRRSIETLASPHALRAIHSDSSAAPPSRSPWQRWRRRHS